MLQSDLIGRRMCSAPAPPPPVDEPRLPLASPEEHTGHPQACGLGQGLRLRDTRSLHLQERLTAQASGATARLEPGEGSGQGLGPLSRAGALPAHGAPAGR